MVPEGWKRVTLRDIALINPAKPKRPFNGKVSFIPMEAVSESATLLRQDERSYEDVEKGFTSFVDGDVLIAKITPCFENGKGALVRGLTNQIGFGSTEFHVLRATENSVPEYIYYLVNSMEFRVRGEMNMQGSAGQKRVTTDYLRLFKFSLPPLPEQKKIAQILSTWDKAITTTEQLLTNSQQQKKALMQQLLTGKKRLLDKNGVRFNVGWKITPIAKMGKVVSGGTPDTNVKEFWDGNMWWLTPTDVTAMTSRFVNKTNRTITELGVKNSAATIIPTGSLMVCTRATIGALAISTSDICTNQGFKSIIPNKNFDIGVIYYAISYYRNKLLRKASGSTFLELSKKDFEKIEMPLPLIEEQKAISMILSKADQEISDIQKKLDAMKKEKKALMQQLLTGKCRVKAGE